MISCPVCENESNFRLVEKTGDFSMYECPDCGLQFAQPLSYRADYYEDRYSASMTVDQIRMRKLSKRQMMKKSLVFPAPWWPKALQWLKDDLAPGSPVLEVGFGNGWFMAALEQEGFQAMGLEVAKEPVEQLKQKGFMVHRGSIEDVPSGWPEPQAVIVFEVIEHIPEPVQFLRGLCHRFPHACLLVSTPSWDRWTLHLGFREDLDHPPNHLLRWTKISLAMAFSRAGYNHVAFHLPGNNGMEIYWTAAEAIFYGLRLQNVRSPAAVLRDSRGKSYLSRIYGRVPSLAVQCHEIGKSLSRVLLRPLACYFDSKGWSSGSALALAKVEPQMQPADAQDE